MTEYEAIVGSPNSTVIPRLVRNCALERGIQYAAASWFDHKRFWNTGSSDQAGR